jgi:hypothetical protein
MRETELSPGLEHRHGHRVGKIQAAVSGTHRQAQAHPGRERLQQFPRQAGGFGAEYERIAFPELLNTFTQDTQSACTRTLAYSW